MISELAFDPKYVCVGGGSKAKAFQISNTAARWNIVRARSKRSKQDSLPQETGRAKSSRYIILFNTGSVRIECFLGLFCRTQVLENQSDDLF